MNDDLTLIKQAMDGETEAFGKLMNKYISMVYGTACSITGDRTDAEDAVQETFLKAYNSLEGFKEKSTFKTWLYRIAVNTCYDILRKKSIRQSFPLDSITPVMADAGNRADSSYALELLKMLPAPDRTIIALKDLEGFSYKEIADILKCSVANVRVRLHRARLELLRRHNENNR